MPWSTANEDLVELFETTGQVELAEILYEGARSKGCGVVQFAQVQEAETAIGTLQLHGHIRYVLTSDYGTAAKFQQYMYGGRPLGKHLLKQFTTWTILKRRSTQTSGSTIAGTRSRLAPQRAARRSPCRPRLPCNYSCSLFRLLLLTSSNTSLWSVCICISCASLSSLPHT